MANIPNLLTVTRIILIPVIVVLFYMPFPTETILRCLFFLLQFLQTG